MRHLLPNTMGPFMVLVTAQRGGSILVEAALSFLGLGIPEPYPSWGRMLSIAAAEYAEKAPCSATRSATPSTRGCVVRKPVRF